MIKVSQEIFEGLDAVRESGLVNMFDKRGVAKIAKTMGYDETVEWLKSEEGKSLYSQGIMEGFEAE